MAMEFTGTTLSWICRSKVELPVELFSISWYLFSITFSSVMILRLCPVLLIIQAHQIFHTDDDPQFWPANALRNQPLPLSQSLFGLRCPHLSTEMRAAPIVLSLYLEQRERQNEQR